jgi:arabinogalactan oligomer/maltooligosaccharide transport system substrate-binding protein
MKYTKFGVLLLAMLVAFGSFGFALAQDMMEPVNLVIWSQDGDNNNAVLAEQFAVWAEKMAPGSTLEIVQKETESLRTEYEQAALAGSGLPDMVLIPNDVAGVFAAKGLVQPLDELFDFSVYVNSGATQIAGVTYGVPVNAGNHLMLLYNKQYVETAPDTWVDLVATAKAVTEANPDVQGFAYNLNEPFWFVPFVYGFGGTVYDAEGKMQIDTQAWVDAYQFVQDLKFKDAAVPQECDYACADSLFKEGSVAMILNGDWSLADYLDPEKSPGIGEGNLGIAPWPALPNGERPKPFVAGKFISIAVGVEGAKRDAAVSFITWLSTDPDAVTAYALGTSRLPAVTTVPVEDPVLSASAAAMATGVGFPPDASLRCMWDSVRPNLEGVMSNSVTPADAAAEAQIAAEDCLASLE